MSTNTLPPPPVQGPPTPPPPAKRPWWRRHKIAAGALAAVALIVVVAVIGAIAGTGTNVSTTPSSPATTSAPPAAAEPSTPPTTAAPPETAAPTPTPPPKAVTYTGVGAKVLKISKGSDPMAVTIKHDGSSNFAVTNLDSNGKEIDLLVNTIGSYSGTRLIDAMQGEQTAALKIEADGNWSVTLKPLTMLRMWDGTGTWTGKGDDLVVIQSGAFAGLDSVKITNSAGESNFIVTAYGDTEDLLVNEIGSYSGEQLMPAGTVLLEIQSEGTWTLTKV